MLQTLKQIKMLCPECLGQSRRCEVCADYGLIAIEADEFDAWVQVSPLEPNCEND